MGYTWAGLGWTKAEVHKAPCSGTSGLAGSHSPLHEVIHLRAGAGVWVLPHRRKPLLLQTGHRKVRQEIQPQDLLAPRVHCRRSPSSLRMPSCNTSSGSSKGPKTWTAVKMQVVSVAGWSLGFQASRKAGGSRTFSRGLSFYIKQPSLQLQDLPRSIAVAEGEAVCRT